MQPLVVFRVDASATIGAGHLRRCLTLAEKLKQDGFRCLFVCRAHAQNLNDNVESAGFELAELAAPELPGGELLGYAAWLAVSQSRDARETLEVIEAAGPIAALVVDHYGIDESWERQLRQIAPRILAVDDLANRRHDVDVFVDATPGADANAYSSLVSPTAELLLGPEFALLRPEFRKARRRLKPRDGRLRRILVAFGATDAGNWSAAAIDGIRAALGDSIAIDVVVSRVAAHREALEARQIIDDLLTIHVDTPHMAELMEKADIAVGAGGTTSWERACLALPSVLCAIADNQRPSLAALESEGCALVLAEDRQGFAVALEEVLRCLARRPGFVRLMGKAGQVLVDGAGAKRVADALLAPSLSVRRANLQDMSSIWSWRNEARVRLASRTSEPIPWDTHQAWFQDVIDEERTELVVCDDLKGAVAVLRFDLEKTATEISIYLTPHGSGRSLGATVLLAAEAWLRKTYPNVLKVNAVVRPDNAASIAAFSEAGYISALLQFERDLYGAPHS